MTAIHSTTPVSLKNVAETVGVSISLVSKVLNGKMGNTGVSEKTAAKIRTTAADMGYRRNASAEALRVGRQDAIGVVIHRHGEAGSPLIENMLLGISKEARIHHQRLILHFFEDTAEFLELSRSLHRGNMDALILGGRLHPELEPRILEVRRAGLPVVTIFEEPFHEEVVNVGSDQVCVGEIATRHLLEQGCASVGLVDSHPPRLKGYLRAMDAAGITVNPAWIYKQETFGYESGVKAARFWLESGEVPQGVVGESDLHALGVIHTLSDAGISVPGQVKVTGMDNSPFCDYVRPTLSSVSQQNALRGQKAMKILLNTRTQPDARSCRVDPVLHVRDSSRG